MGDKQSSLLLSINPGPERGSSFGSHVIRWMHCDPVTAKILGHFYICYNDLAVLLFSTAVEVS